MTYDRRSFCLGVVLALSSCRTDWSVEPEGLRCDEGNVCPAGLECRGGVCLRPLFPDTLSSTCDNGCAVPPPPECRDDTRRSHEGPGACQKDTGTCTWSVLDTPCPHGCFQGECRTGPRVFTRRLGALDFDVAALDVAPASDGRGAVAVGPNGQVARLSGSGWQRLESPTREALKAVWFSDAQRAFVVGGSSTVLEVTGNAVNALALPLAPGESWSFVDVHGRNSQHVVMVSEDGSLLRFDGQGFRKSHLPPEEGPWEVTSVYVSPSGQERVLGRCRNGNELCLSKSDAFSETFSVQRLSAAGAGVLGPALDASFQKASVALRAEALLWEDGHSGLSAVDVQPLFPGAGFVGLVEGPGSQVHVLTRAGPSHPLARLYRYSTSQSQAIMTFPFGALLSMSRRGAESVAVADAASGLSSVYRLSPASIEPTASRETWVSASLGPDGTHALLSASGHLWLKDARGPSTYLRPEETSLRMRSVALGKAFHLVVGEQGRVFRVEKSFQALASGTSSAWTSVCRTSDDTFYLVGDNGRIRSFDGREWTTWNSNVTTSLLHVSCAQPQSVLACGNEGRLLKLEGGAWKDFSPAFPLSKPLSHCEATSDGTVYVAGSNVFYRFREGEWTALPSLAGLSNVVRLSDREVYAVAEGNKVARFDGTTWTVVASAMRNLRTSTRTQSGLWFAGEAGEVWESSP